jgi:hypothetical protein
MILELLDGFQDQKAGIGEDRLRVALENRHRLSTLGDSTPNSSSNLILLLPKVHLPAPNSRKSPNQVVKRKTHSGEIFRETLGLY